MHVVVGRDVMMRSCFRRYDVHMCISMRKTVWKRAFCLRVFLLVKCLSAQEYFCSCAPVVSLQPVQIHTKTNVRTSYSLYVLVIWVVKREDISLVLRFPDSIWWSTSNRCSLKNRERDFFVFVIIIVWIRKNIRDCALAGECARTTPETKFENNDYFTLPKTCNHDGCYYHIFYERSDILVVVVFTACHFRNNLRATKAKPKRK